MKVLIWLATALPVALLMEPWAAFVHGRIWHGVLWRVHASHHRPRKGRFEANDVLAASHAPIAIAMILYGCLAEPGIAREVVFGAGLGMTLFGVAYTLVHDGLAHRRLPVQFLRRWTYLDRVRRAHLVHHGRGDAPHGLFFGPWIIAREQRARDSIPNVPGEAG